MRDQFGESGTLEEIKECYGLTPPFIKEAVLGVMKAKKSKSGPPKRRLLGSEISLTVN